MNMVKKPESQAGKVRKGSTGWMLKILCTSLDAEMSDELRRLGLNLGQFAVLMTLSEAEGLTQSEIGKKITMPGYATTRTIDALEEKRFVERRKDNRSRRSYRIYLTDQSRKVVPQLFAVVGKVNEHLLSALTPKEQKDFMKILQKLVLSRTE
ncbi:MAG: MarR family transcriptional regulator [Chromatiales bacterium]|nr:MarR family transcriptional regulator [Chromatiales bacterium]